MATGVVVTIALAGWSLIAFRANADARAATISDSIVANTRRDGMWRFAATNAAAAPRAGLLFFPGALVDPAAYAPLARAVAAAGFPVTLMELPRRGALGGANDRDLLGRALDHTRTAGAAHRWVVAGHSRGAVAAVDFAASYPTSIAGLVLIGTTHPRDADLSRLAAPVTKIVGTNDGIAPLRKSEANRRLLPGATRWIRIEGGNHSQFGWYGFQPGDHVAGISAERQHAQMLSAILDALRAAADSVPPAM